MSFRLIGGGSDLNGVVSDINQNILELKNREVTEIFKDSTGTQRVLLGEGSNGFYGMKVSRAGKDVYTAADTDLVFNSSQNVFKIVSSGTAVIGGYSVTSTAGNFTSGNASITVNHNLGYVPAVIAYLLLGGSYYAIPYSNTSGAGPLCSWLSVNFLVDATSITFQSQDTAYGATTDTRPAVTVKYYLLQETAN